MRPLVTASRSAAPIATEAHVVPLPARSRCSDDASPPAAGTGTRSPSAPARNVRGPRLETTMVWLTRGAAERRERTRAPVPARRAGRRLPGAAVRAGGGCDEYARRGRPGPVDPSRGPG